jgi:hypothetical protein
LTVFILACRGRIQMAFIYIHPACLNHVGCDMSKFLRIN